MLARFFIDRPIFAWVISIVIVLVGIVAVETLPISQYPNITPPMVTVSASYPGANAQVVADTVAAPIEQQVNGVEDMLYMSSQSTNDGNYVLNVTFAIGTDVNMAQVLVQNRVALAMPLLPQQVQLQGVSTKKKSPSILLAINFISPDGRYDDIYLSNFATTRVRDQILQIPGIGDVNYLGQRDYSMRVWLDPEKMSSRNLTATDVVNAIQEQNVQVAAGQIGQQPVPAGQEFQLTMQTLGRLDTTEEFGDIILKAEQQNSAQQETPSAQVVHLRDVARIELGAQNYDQICQLDGQPSVALAVFQLPGSNALQVADAVKAKMEELSKTFEQGVEYRIVYDTTPFINESINEVFKTLRDAVLLVAIVVLFFLQDYKAMILPMIDVPVSLIGSFAVMAVFGFTLNNLTLFGLVLAIGIVVDDAIVVLENIERLMQKGMDVRSATIQAMDEITGPILAITLVLSSVFIPSAFVPGLVGQFYQQFALTIATAMIISAINAMTLTPARAVTVFRSEKPGDFESHRQALPWWIFGVFGGVLTAMYGPQFFELPTSWGLTGTSTLDVRIREGIYFIPGLIAGLLLGWIIIKPVNALLSAVFGAFNWFFDKITKVYGWFVGRMVRLAVIMLVVYAGLIYLTGHTLAITPKGFLPTQDQGYLIVNAQLPDSASVQRTQNVLDDVCDIAAKIPGVAHTLSVSGQSVVMNTNGSNFGSVFVILQGFDERESHEKYDAVIAEKLRAICEEQITEATISVFRSPPIQGLGSGGSFKMQIEQRGFYDLPELQTTCEDVIADAEKDPRISTAFTIFRADTPQIYLDIDRTKCEALQVPVNDVFETLQVFMGGMFVNNFNKFGRTWQVQVQAESKFRTNIDYLKNLKVRNNGGDMVPLGTLIVERNIGGPVMVMRYNTFTSAAILANPRGDASFGEVVNAMNKAADAEGATYEWTEICYLMLQAGNTGYLVFGLGGLLVYLVLAAKYESWRLPLSVIMVVPLCLLAAGLGMLITSMSIDIFVQIGFLVLVGLAAKNAILIVEFADQLVEQGRSTRDAIIESCVLRFRPIVMTSFAFIFGVLPLVFSEGAGAEMRVSLGTAVFSGMIGVTLFGLILTPVFYTLFIKKREARKVEGESTAADSPITQTSTPAT